MAAVRVITMVVRMALWRVVSMAVSTGVMMAAQTASLTAVY